MVLTYQTDLSLDDVAALAAEVDNIWDVFKVDVEAQHLNNALIKPTRITFGGVVSKSRGFVYEKQPDGSWHRLSDQ
ncbi:MAG: hypothetical protein QOJ98_795 [Acidobacteriota bacterium]|nr:hypothetical protein [Acidobacteriota bacterium]